MIDYLVGLTETPVACQILNTHIHINNTYTYMQYNGVFIWGCRYIYV